MLLSQLFLHLMGIPLCAEEAFHFHVIPLYAVVRFDTGAGLIGYQDM